MEKILKRLFVFLLMFAAVAAFNAPRLEAAGVAAKAAVNNDKSHWEEKSGNLRFNITGLPAYGEYILKMPQDYHYVLTDLNGKDFKVVGGSYYVKDGALASPGSSDKHLALKYYEVDKNFNVSKAGTTYTARNILSSIPSTTCKFGDQEFKYGDGTPYTTTRTVDTDGTIVYVPNAGRSYTGVDDNGLVCNKGALYSGFAYKDGKMYKVTSGKIAADGYTGSVGKYFNCAAKAEKTANMAYKDGLLINGWVISGSMTYGYYKNGVLNKSVNNWCKNPSNGKWYYFESGKIYRTGSKGPAKKKLRTNGLDYWGHGKASPGSYRYYLNADGSLVTNVFATDSSWFKKKMRIYINAKAGIDNVTFMGYIKGSGYCVPLKTIVTTCSKKNATLKKQVRGAGGKGKWKLGRKGGSRHRWFLFHKNGHTYYYQYATSILGSGALFHSPRFLRRNIRSLYKPHFNAMGKSNITTKCVRLQVANALMVYNISKKCKSYNYVTFIRKGRTKKTSYLPFGITELSDAIGKATWDQNYDPSDPGIK